MFAPHEIAKVAPHQAKTFKLSQCTDAAQQVIMRKLLRHWSLQPCSSSCHHSWLWGAYSYSKLSSCLARCSRELYWRIWVFQCDMLPGNLVAGVSDGPCPCDQRATGARAKTGTRALMVIGVFWGVLIYARPRVVLLDTLHYNGPNKENIVHTFREMELSWHKWASQNETRHLLRTKISLANDYLTAHYDPLIPWTNSGKLQIGDGKSRIQACIPTW